MIASICATPKIASPNPQADARGLFLFDSLRQFTKVLGLLVTGLCLELRKLPRFLIGKVRNQSLKFGCRLIGLVSLFEHQMFKFPDCLIVIHVSLAHIRCKTRQLRSRLFKISAAMERLHPRCRRESIGRWYWRYLDIEPLRRGTPGSPAPSRPIRMCRRSIPSSNRFLVAILA